MFFDKISSKEPYATTRWEDVACWESCAGHFRGQWAGQQSGATSSPLEEWYMRLTDSCHQTGPELNHRRRFASEREWKRETELAQELYKCQILFFPAQLFKRELLCFKAQV